MESQGQHQFLLMAVLGAVKECSSLGADLVVHLWGWATVFQEIMWVV